jgi:hypothetical protein
MKTTLFCLMVLVAGIVLSGCSQQITLFDGQDLDSWNMYLQDKNTEPAAVWSVQDGVIHCKGKPSGYLRTKEDYSNYKLHVEWRWPAKPTNSGVLLHAGGEDKLWPLSMEAQLQHRNAGDLVTIQAGSAITVNGQRHTPPGGERFYKIIAKQHESSENPPGQWNSYDIICKGDSIQLTVNGVLQNTAAESTLTSGAICLQSEGSPIEFKNITLTPLK